jgi:hypothetical protein
MVSDRELRMKAGFALATALGDPATRAIFETNGYVDEQQIAVALESDTLQDVYTRLQRYTPPVIVAIYWPESGKLRFTQMEPGTEPADYSPERDDVRGASTIGMLWEHTERQEHAQFRFRLQWGQPTMSVVRFDSVSA